MDIKTLASIAGVLGFFISVATFVLTRIERRKNKANMGSPNLLSNKTKALKIITFRNKKESSEVNYDTTS